MVDLDPQMQMTSELWGVGLRLEDGNGKLLLEGELRFIIGDETHEVRPGEMWRIPGGVTHSAIAGDAPVKALDVFHPIREDYL